MRSILSVALVLPLVGCSLLGGGAGRAEAVQRHKEDLLTISATLREYAKAPEAPTPEKLNEAADTLEGWASNLSTEEIGHNLSSIGTAAASLPFPWMKVGGGLLALVGLGFMARKRKPLPGGSNDG